VCASRVRSSLLALGVGLLVLLGGPSGVRPAGAHDAPMPAGARHGLLPDEPWVMAHWAPFDERTLTEALRLRPRQLEAFLYNDHHTIAQLARQRRVGFTGLVRRLTAWTAAVPGADRAEMERRTRLVLVSGHLAQHVFHHVFHGFDLVPRVVRAADVRWATYDALRARRWSMRRIVARSGAVPATVELDLATTIDAERDRGVSALQTPASQGARMAARQRGRLHCWFTRPAQALDPSAPYDRGYTKHAAAHTSRDVPATRAEQAAEDRTIARGLARLTDGCWAPPQRFRDDPGAPLSRRRLRVLGGVPSGFKGPVNDTKHHRGHHM
jgi:hypothetical protein